MLSLLLLEDAKAKPFLLLLSYCCRRVNICGDMENPLLPFLPTLTLMWPLFIRWSILLCLRIGIVNNYIIRWSTTPPPPWWNECTTPALLEMTTTTKTMMIRNISILYHHRRETLVNVRRPCYRFHQIWLCTFTYYFIVGGTRHKNLMHCWMGYCVWRDLKS